MGQNEKILRSVYARYAKSGLVSVISEFDENVVWRSPGAANRIRTAGEWRGRDGARAFFATLGRDWTLKALQLHEIYSSDDCSFAARIRVLAASNTTGKTVQVEKVDFVTMRNGKITSYAEVFDTAPFERASRL